MEILCMELHKVLSFCPQLTLFLLNEKASGQLAIQLASKSSQLITCKIARNQFLL